MSLEKTVVKWGREFLDMWVQRGILPAFWGSSMSQISGMLHPGLGEDRGKKKYEEKKRRERERNTRLIRNRNYLSSILTKLQSLVCHL